MYCEQIVCLEKLNYKCSYYKFQRLMKMWTVKQKAVICSHYFLSPFFCLPRQVEYGIWAPCAQLYSLAETPKTHLPSPGIWAYIRGRYWSAKRDDISLWPPDRAVPVPTVQCKHYKGDIVGTQTLLIFNSTDQMEKSLPIDSFRPPPFRSNDWYTNWEVWNCLINIKWARENVTRT